MDGLKDVVSSWLKDVVSSWLKDDGACWLKDVSTPSDNRLVPRDSLLSPLGIVRRTVWSRLRLIASSGSGHFEVELYCWENYYFLSSGHDKTCQEGPPGPEQQHCFTLAYVFILTLFLLSHIHAHLFACEASDNYVIILSLRDQMTSLLICLYDNKKDSCIREK